MGSLGVQPVIDYENDDNLSDEELLNLPSDSLPVLSRVWAVRSGLLFYKQMVELAAERSGNARTFMLFHDQDPRRKEREEEERRRARLALEVAMQEIRDHADRILLRIDEQENEIRKRREKLEARALQLHDGRLVWVDGARFRDDSGTVLEGRDHAEAAALAHDRPDTATWAERDEIRISQEKMDRLRENVQKERDGQGDTAGVQDRLTQYEKELQADVEQRHAQVASAPVDYGDPDYTDLLVPSAQPAFTAAAQGTAAPELNEEKKTESASADNKRVFRSPGQGTPKPC
jgi:hypothetical protein